MSQVSPRWAKAVELTPARQAQVLAAHPVCWQAWASLTAPVPHLPVGARGLIAEAVAERSAHRVGGLIYPLLWRDEQCDLAGFRQQLLARLAWAASQQCALAVIVGLPTTPADDLALIEIAETVMRQSNLLILALSPLELVDATMHDQGGLWETSMTLALRPDLVDLNDIAASMAQNVRDVASPSLGQQALTLASERLSVAARDLLAHRNVTALTALYQQRRLRYQSLMP